MARDSAAAAGVPWRSRSLRAILASTAILPLGVPMLSPVLPAIRDHFGVGDTGASLVVVAYFLPAMLLSPLVGVFVARAGRRWVLAGALTAWSVAGTTVAFDPPFVVVLLTRVVQGAAAASVLVVTVTLVGDLFEGRQRTAVIGANAATLFAGAAVAPLVGGTLVEYGWNVPFVAFVVGFPVAAFAFHSLAEPAHVRSPGGLALVRGAVAALPTRAAVGFYGSAALVDFLTFGAVLTAVPFVLAGAGTDPVRIGAVVTANLLVSAAVSANVGRFAAWVPDRRLVAAGFAVVGVGLLGAWVAAGPVQFGVSVAVFGAGYGLVFPAVDAAVTDLAPPEFRAGALSFRNTATFFGRGTGPVAFAAAASVVGYRPVLGVAGVAVLLAGLAALRRWR